MNVQGVGPKFFVDDEKAKILHNKSGENPKKDKIEISEEAKSLQSNPALKDLSEIKKRIAAKFYDTQEVIAKVAEKMLKEIRE